MNGQHRFHQGFYVFKNKWLLMKLIPLMRNVLYSAMHHSPTFNVLYRLARKRLPRNPSDVLEEYGKIWRAYSEGLESSHSVDDWLFIDYKTDPWINYVEYKFKIIGGGYDGEKIDFEKINFLATLPSMDELRGKIVGLISAPAQKIASIMKEPAGQVARLVSAQSNSLEKSNQV